MQFKIAGLHSSITVTPSIYTKWYITVRTILFQIKRILIVKYTATKEIAVQE